jgi:hypothetical protein
MEKEFVPHEQALALKELGFDDKPFYFNSPQEAYSAAFDYIKDNHLNILKNTI